MSGLRARRWWSGQRAFGCGAATAGGDVLLGAVKVEKHWEETGGRGLEWGDERDAGRRGCCWEQVASGALQSLISELRLFGDKGSRKWYN